MPPANSRNNQKTSTRRMIDVTEKELREVYEAAFKICSWATASEVYDALKTTGFDEQRAIDKLNAGRTRQPTNNAANEILGGFGLEPDPEDGAEEMPGNHTMEVHDQPKLRITLPSKRASPIPDPRAENQMSKRPRRNAPQKPMANNSRDTAIIIYDEDEISDSSQQLPPPPRESPRAFTNGVDSPHLLACPSSLDSVTDPIEPETRNADSAHPTPEKRPALFTNNSSPAKINSASPKAHPSPRTSQQTQASIKQYMLPVPPQRQGVDFAQIAPTVQGFPPYSNRDVWRSRHRPPTRGPPKHRFPERKDSPSSENTSAPASATITTVNSDSDEKEGAGPPQIDPSRAFQPKRLSRDVFNDDSYNGSKYSSPFPYKKTGQGTFEEEILPKRSSSPALLSSLKQGEVRGRRASPGFMDDKEISVIISVKSHISDVSTLPAPPRSPLKGKGKRPTIEVLIEKEDKVDGPSRLKAELRGERAPREIPDEIPSSQPSPPPITPDLALNSVREEEEIQEVIEVHGGMRETRKARQSSSELNEPPSTLPSPDRPKKKKQDVELVVDDNEEEDNIDKSFLPPVVKKSGSSKPKRSAPRGRRVALEREREKKAGKMRVNVGQNEERGEQEEEVKQEREVMMTRERRRRVGRG
ncbi:hypothetical protein EV426DRAFT_701775 [Tirmania nivea]|nr:hypothetical protein EV426DRAFT_701775 [Tirmania nivea]